MKNIKLAFGIIIFIISAQLSASTPERSALDVIERFSGKELPVDVSINLPEKDGRDVYKSHIENGRLKIEASSPVSACRAFYDYLKDNGLGINSWSGSRIEFPDSLPVSSPYNKDVESPFRHHYYFNVVTFGYSMPYWNWARWEKEIDWMAMHGIDMPLALVANEAVSRRVWKKLGLTEEEISRYFVGPAHLPWMRMGNISHVDSPLPESWHESQIELQHKILDRMKSLGMKPICPAFAGFVPEGIKKFYPDSEIFETSWLGGVSKNWMLSPDSPLFARIGKMYIEEWEKEFGKNDYYIADSFNEMDIPFPPKGSSEREQLLAGYGKEVYGSISAANPDAVWVMQGWMFGYMRQIWDYETLGALVSQVPNDKMLILDLAVDYNKCFWKIDYNWEFYKGFFGKEWVYSVIPNMGGKNALSGIPDFYANGKFAALDSKNRGRLAGFGIAPEGIENNEVLYELITDAGWSNDSIDVNQWFRDYARNRYGKYCPSLGDYWNGLQKSVYSTLVDNPRYNWQYRPGTMYSGNVNVNGDFYKAIEDFSKAHAALGESPLYRADLIENTVHYLGAKMEIALKNWETAFSSNDLDEAQKWELKFEELALAADRLLLSHPTMRLENWLEKAESTNPENDSLRQYYNHNARRIITTWVKPPLDDYAARIWSGLIRDYYLPRWKHYFESKRSDVPFDLAEWEKTWVDSPLPLSSAEPYPNPLEACLDILKDASRLKLLPETNDGSQRLGGWSTSDFSGGGEAELIWNIPASKAKDLKEVRLRQTRGEGKPETIMLLLEMDGISYSPIEHEVKPDGSEIFFFNVPSSATGNNSCRLHAKLGLVSPGASHGMVSIVTAED